MNFKNKLVSLSVVSLAFFCFGVETNFVDAVKTVNKASSKASEQKTSVGDGDKKAKRLRGGKVEAGKDNSSRKVNDEQNEEDFKKCDFEIRIARDPNKIFTVKKEDDEKDKQGLDVFGSKAGTTEKLNLPLDVYGGKAGTTEKLNLPLDAFVGKAGTTEKLNLPLDAFVGKAGTTEKLNLPLDAFVGKAGTAEKLNLPLDVYGSKAGTTEKLNLPLDAFGGKAGTTEKLNLPLDAFVGKAGTTEKLNLPLDAFGSKAGTTEKLNLPLDAFVGKAGTTEKLNLPLDVYGSKAGTTEKLNLPLDVFGSKAGTTEKLNLPLDAFGGKAGIAEKLNLPCLDVYGGKVGIDEKGKTAVVDFMEQKLRREKELFNKMNYSKTNPVFALGVFLCGRRPYMNLYFSFSSFLKKYPKAGTGGIFVEITDDEGHVFKEKGRFDLFANHLDLIRVPILGNSEEVRRYFEAKKGRIDIIANNKFKIGVGLKYKVRVLSVDNEVLFEDFCTSENGYEADSRIVIGEYSLEFYSQKVLHEANLNEELFLESLLG